MLRLCLSLTLRIGVDCCVLSVPGEEGAELTRQDMLALETWEVWTVVKTFRRDLCQHLVHPESWALEY